MDGLEPDIFMNTGVSRVFDRNCLRMAGETFDFTRFFLRISPIDNRQFCIILNALFLFNRLNSGNDQEAQ